MELIGGSRSGPVLNLDMSRAVPAVYGATPNLVGALRRRGRAGSEATLRS